MLTLGCCKLLLLAWALLNMLCYDSFLTCSIISRLILSWFDGKKKGFSSVVLFSQLATCCCMELECCEIISAIATTFANEARKLNVRAFVIQGMNNIALYIFIDVAPSDRYHGKRQYN